MFSQVPLVVSKVSVEELSNPNTLIIEANLFSIEKHI